MARRKRNILEDDDDSDSSVSDDNDDLNDPTYDHDDPDAREERALFENPYQRKRRRKNGKEDAIYGVFASSDEDEDEGFGKKKRGKGHKRSDWTKAPAFVSKAQVDLTKEMDEDERMQDAEDEGDVDDNEEEDEEEEVDDIDAAESGLSKPASPRVRDEEEEEERPRFGGLGMGKSKQGDNNSLSASTHGGIGSSKGGIGSSKGGIGSSKGGIGLNRGGIGSFSATSTVETSPFSAPTPPPPSSDANVLPDSLPSSFGAAASGSRAQRSFVRDDAPRSGSGTPAPLSAAERAHFSKLGGTFGARMLEKMGWQAGTGLGTTGEGIVTPVESKLRPKGMGLAFKGFKEKTEQSKAEARRRGEEVSDDEEIKPKKGRKAKGTQEPADRSETWKKPKKLKKKIEHKTYEQIVAEAGAEAPSAGIGPIIDATGATLREVSSLADVSISGWTPSTDPTRLPELRHNLRLINETCKSDLDGLAREARTLEDRKKWIAQEDVRLRKQVEQEAELISRLQQVHLVVDDISAQAKQLESMYEASLDPFSVHFDKLLGLYPKEFERYHLDEIVVAAIAPTARRLFAQWNPMQEPTAFTSLFRSWRHAFRMNTEEKLRDQVQVYGSSTVVTSAVPVEKPMTPYESFIWNVWMPKVQSAIVNSWSAEDPSPAVMLYEAWSALLPPFVRDNFFDQLVLPKVQRAIGDWNPKRHTVPLETVVFPWLPHIGLRSEQVLEGARRKIKQMLRAWMVTDGVPKDLLHWKDVFDQGEWDTMILKYVIPKLGSRLRDDFRINPRKQDMQPLQDVLQWEGTLRPSIISQLLQKEFFPKWLDVLYIWLIQPKVSFEEVSQWYSFWKGTFSENVQSIPGVSQGFTKGLQLMNKAIELGPEAPSRLPKPDHSTSPPPPPVTKPSIAASRPSRTQEISFRSIVEDYLATHNLLFFPTGKVHEKSRLPLFRVSPTADGKGGVLVYIQDDAVWAPDGDGDDYRAISLENVVLRAARNV
ncbi:TFP11-domain-containing protein [Cristinia sonorae]|uniref:TFP11-domain-containing protein n=1 Tax=Cristinia sonorae TaxID=1940300 RepID=A0A8K0UCQ8_9AGAR|nr:TFP11-domain-containing protein [Cristinia sonorae]